MTIDFTTEWPLIRDEANREGCDPFFVAAIRVAEGGAAGREFGVLSIPAPTYADQLRIACVSVKNHFVGPLVIINGRKAYSSGEVRTFATRWAPPSVANDPSGLNQNWFQNCWGAYATFCQNKAVA